MTKRVAFKGSSIAVSAVMGMVIGIAAASGFFATRGVEAAQQGGAAQQGARGQGAPAAAAVAAPVRAAALPEQSIDQERGRRARAASSFAWTPWTRAASERRAVQRRHQRAAPAIPREGSRALRQARCGDPWRLAAPGRSQHARLDARLSRSRPPRAKSGPAFGKDPEWDALRKKYSVPSKTNTFLMSASDYSPMK